jgi:hypothetical protein
MMNSLSILDDPTFFRSLENLCLVLAIKATVPYLAPFELRLLLMRIAGIRSRPAASLTRFLIRPDKVRAHFPELVERIVDCGYFV